MGIFGYGTDANLGGRTDKIFIFWVVVSLNLQLLQAFTKCIFVHSNGLEMVRVNYVISLEIIFYS